MGLVNEVCSPDAVIERAYDYARRITANGPLAVRKTKESVIRGLAVDMKEAYRIESAISSEVFSSEDASGGAQGLRREANTGVEEPLIDWHGGGPIGGLNDGVYTFNAVDGEDVTPAPREYSTSSTPSGPSEQPGLDPTDGD